MIAQNLTFKELGKNTNKVAVLPVGSLEQHGLYLPLSADSIAAESVALEVEKQISNKVVVYPPLYYGCSKEHAGFTGTVYFEFDTYYKLVSEILKSIFDAGFKKVLIIGGHGGNHLILQIIQANWNYEHRGQKVFYHFVYSDKVIDYAQKLFKDMEEHAGSVETSVIYSISDTYVKTKKDKITNRDFKKKFPEVFSLYSTKEMSNSGTINPSDTIEISKEKGGKVFRFMVQETKQLVNQIHKTIKQ